MQHPLQQVKRLFIRMTLREKLLSLLFILVMLSIWTSSLLKRSSDWNSNRKQAQSDLKIQQQWLDRSDQFAAGLNRALERVDFKAGIQFFGVTSVLGDADALDVDIWSFLTE